MNYLNNTSLEDIKKNWYSENTQQVIKNFLFKYANFSNNWVNELIEKLK